MFIINSKITSQWIIWYNKYKGKLLPRKMISDLVVRCKSCRSPIIFFRIPNIFHIWQEKINNETTGYFLAMLKGVIDKNYKFIKMKTCVSPKSYLFVVYHFLLISLTFPILRWTVVVRGISGYWSIIFKMKLITNLNITKLPSSSMYYLLIIFDFHMLIFTFLSGNRKYYDAPFYHK